jgi:mannosyltransferase
MRADPGGVEVVAPNLKRRLSGVTATVVRLVPVQARGIGIATVGPGLPEGLPRLSWAQVATLPRDRLRVWHARRNTEMLAGLVLRCILRRRLALLFTSAAQRRHSRYTRGLVARMDAVVATSRRAASYLEREATVIPHGVDLEAFRPGAERWEPGTWVGCFGRIRAQKGTDLFVEAMLALMPERPALRALLVGRTDDDAFAEGLRTRIGEAGLAERFRWEADLSWEALAARYRAMALYAAPQRWEGFGLTPLEAMASGVPVVATTVGAFPDLVRDSETGRLVPPEDAGALAAAMAEILDDPGRRASMARAARAHVEAHHGIEAEARALEAVYRSLLAGA